MRVMLMKLEYLFLIPKARPIIKRQELSPIADLSPEKPQK